VPSVNSSSDNNAYRRLEKVGLPTMMRGEYFLSVCLANQDIAGWVDISCAVRLNVAGTPTARGRVFHNTHGAGFICLSEATGRAEGDRADRKVQDDHA
jgi:hypothetical protein